MSEAALVLLVIGVVAVVWASSMRAREAAVAACADACRAYGVQLLDASVALVAVGLRRAPGGLKVRRVYQFAFSPDGRERLTGSVTMLGAEVEALYLPPLPPRLT